MDLMAIALAKKYVADLVNDSPEALTKLKEITTWLKTTDGTGTSAALARIDAIEATINEMQEEISNIDTSGSSSSSSSSSSSDTSTSYANKMDKLNAKGTGTFSINRLSSSTIGDYSTAFGYNGTASSTYSTAMGYQSSATTGTVATATGAMTTASGANSHSEGYKTTASGGGSHVENQNNIASGSLSHAEGENTEARGRAQHVQGVYNVIDTTVSSFKYDNKSVNKYAHIVGNGTSSSARSNAHTLDWNGNAEFQGDVIAYGCDSASTPISLANMGLKVNAIETITDDEVTSMMAGW